MRPDELRTEFGRDEQGSKPYFVSRNNSTPTVDTYTAELSILHLALKI